MNTLFHRLAGGVMRHDRLRATASRYVDRASRVLGSATDERYAGIYERLAPFTRIPRPAYLANLRLVDGLRSIEGCVVECGTWRGGMVAGVAHLLGPARQYHLFDSFQGLPDAAAIDGERAIRWQAENTVQRCQTEEHFVHEAMRIAGATRYRVHAGWFEETLPAAVFDEPIAMLRLDGDWYSSTAVCLNHLYDRVVVGGLVILDDYYTWEGCSRAVHDFLSANASADRIREQAPGIAYLMKSSDAPSSPIDPDRPVPSAG